MTEYHPYDRYLDQIKPCITSKVEEFKLLGYDRATEEDVWKCLKQKKWKKNKDGKLLYEVVNDVMRLSISDYMSWLTMQAYKSPNWFNDEGELDPEELVKQLSKAKPE